MTQSRTQRAVTTLLLALTSASCDATRGPSQGLAAIDSAGIQIIVIGPPDTTSNRWTTNRRPSLDIGAASGPESLTLTNVRAATRLSSGQIVVANRGSNELRYFDQEGQHLMTVGREGRGPGEFQSLDFLWRLAGDSLLAYDVSLQRVSLFDPAGAFVRSSNTTVPGAPAYQQAVAVTSRGDLFTAALVGYDPSTVGRHFMSQVVGIYRRPDRAYMTIDTVRGPETAMVEREGRLLPAIVPFGQKSDYAATADFLFVLDSRNAAVDEDWAISVYSALTGRLIRVLRFRLPRSTIEPSVTARWIDSFFEKNRNVFASERVADTWRYGFERVTPPSRLAPFRSLEIDADGNVCAERYQLTETASQVYWCFSPDGRYRRSVILRTGSRRMGFPLRDPQLEIGRDYILGVWDDDLGVEYVRLYQLQEASLR